MYLTIKGLVLRVTDYNEQDALLSLLTRRLAMMAADRRRQQILQMAEQKGCVSWKGWK